MSIKPATTRVNAVLKANGRAERLVRGRGYYYLLGFAGSSMLTVYRLDPTERDFRIAMNHVIDCFKNDDITIKEKP